VVEGWKEALAVMEEALVSNHHILQSEQKVYEPININAL
jgi:hypothetical protein